METERKVNFHRLFPWLKFDGMPVKPGLREILFNMWFSLFGFSGAVKAKRSKKRLSIGFSFGLFYQVPAIGWFQEGAVATSVFFWRYHYG